MTPVDTSAPVLFRADSYDRIGLGHVKRCAALAQVLRESGIGSVFAVCAEDAVVDGVIKPLDVPIFRFETRVNTGKDIESTVDAARQRGTQAIVIDSYAVDEAYFQALHAASLKTIYFEDYGRGDWPVDMVINGLIGAETIKYVVPRALLGTDYLVLGPEYWKGILKETRKSGDLEIMITVGGIDHYDLTSRTLALLDTMDREMKIHVVAGPYFENEDSIETAAAQCRHRTLIHKQPDSLAPIISRCRMAVSAGGMTLYELAAFGVPTVGIWLWENQRWNVERLGEAGVILPLGYEEGPGFDETLGNAIRGLLNDRQRQQAMRRAGSALVDGQGALRVADALFELSEGSRQPLQKVE